MSSNTPLRIDWDGEGNDAEVTRVLRSRHRMRRLAVPATFALVGLALVGALSAGPAVRHLTSGTGDGVALATANAPAQPVLAMEAAQEAEGTETPAASAPPAAATADAAVRVTAATAQLSTDDPRWNPDRLTVDESKLAALREAVDETVLAAELAGRADRQADAQLLTGTIPAHAAGFAPERPAAGERDVFDAALVRQDDEAEAEADPVESSLSPAKVTQYVNMRSGPSDDARVLTVVPTNASIEAETDCRWCEVSYDGQKGYIFQSFIAR